MPPRRPGRLSSVESAGTLGRLGATVGHAAGGDAFCARSRFYARSDASARPRHAVHASARFAGDWLESGGMGQSAYDSFEAGDGVRIAYRVSGHGHPVIAVHGFTLPSTVNFATHYSEDDRGKMVETDGPTIESALVEAGCQVIMLDLRGHGHSDRPHDSSKYSMELACDDVRALVRHLKLRMAALIGYSMGAAIACDLLADPWVSRVALCGIGSYFVEGEDEDTAAALPIVAKCFLDGRWNEFPEYQYYRTWAALDGCGPDFTALGLVVAGNRVIPRSTLAAAPAELPVMVLNGGADPGADPSWDLSRFIAGAHRVVAGNADHGMAPSDPLVQAALVRFILGD
jgi:pimeloyl-ACP methyl ester carboxylesterase